MAEEAVNVDIQLDKSFERTAAAKEAGDEYVDDLERILNELNTDDGQSLGQMVKSNIEISEAETRYNVKSGIPTKASNVVKDASTRMKQAGG